MADPAWLEVRAVVRCDPELVDKLRPMLEDSGLVEVNRIDVTHLDEDLRRWDGGRPPGVVVEPGPAEHTGALHLVGMPESAATAHPVFDRLRLGHNLETP